MRALTEREPQGVTALAAFGPSRSVNARAGGQSGALPKPGQGFDEAHGRNARARGKVPA